MRQPGQADAGIRTLGTPAAHPGERKRFAGQVVKPRGSCQGSGGSSGLFSLLEKGMAFTVRGFHCSWLSLFMAQTHSLHPEGCRWGLDGAGGIDRGDLLSLEPGIQGKSQQSPAWCQN